MSMRLDDNLQRAIAGDESALALLLEQFAPQVRAQLQGRIPVRCQALFGIDDVMQVTFTDAFLGIGTFKQTSDADFAGWLVTIARRNLHDVIRLIDADKRGGGRRPISQDDSHGGLWDRVSGSSASPSQFLARSELASLLECALSRLPQQHQLIVRLVDLEHAAVADVAKSLNRTPGSVYMIRARAHRLLFELLSASDFFSDCA